VDAVVNFLSHSALGNLLSLIGLVLTGIVYLKVRAIEERYLFAARAPELLARLSEQANTIRELLDTFDTSARLLRAEFGQVEATLTSLEGKLRGAPLTSIRPLRQTLRAYDFRSGPDGAWKVYAEIRRVHEELRNVQEDLQWQK
jgi:hypothetical protein